MFFPRPHLFNYSLVFDVWDHFIPRYLFTLSVSTPCSLTFLSSLTKTHSPLLVLLPLHASNTWGPAPLNFLSPCSVTYLFLWWSQPIPVALAPPALQRPLLCLSSLLLLLNSSSVFSASYRACNVITISYQTLRWQWKWNLRRSLMNILAKEFCKWLDVKGGEENC